MTQNGSSRANGRRHPAPARPDLVTVPPSRLPSRPPADPTAEPDKRAHDAVHHPLSESDEHASPAPRPHQAVRDLLRHIGEDPDREGLRDTPRRVVAAFEELTSGYEVDVAQVLATTFSEQHADDEPVSVQGMHFWSLCEHHLLPFYGTVTVSYIPNGRIVGLSKIARTVHAFARRLQVQERLTEQIADAIADCLDAQGVAVHVKATHLCMAMRGAETMASTVTQAFRGAMKDASSRQRFLDELSAGARTA